MLTTYSEIKQQVSDEWAYFASDSERAIQEMADRLVPIYTGEIIQEWSEMTSDDSNEWQNIYAVADLPQDTTIEKLMSLDLWIYYEGQILFAYEEIVAEKKEAN